MSEDTALRLDSKFGGSGMTVGEAVTRFKQAKDRRMILDILSDESGLTVETVKATFVAAGVDYKLFPRARRKPEPDLPDVKPEDAARLQAERDRPKSPGVAKPKQEQDLTDFVEILRKKAERYNELMVEAGKIREELDQIREILAVFQ